MKSKTEHIESSEFSGPADFWGTWKLTGNWVDQKDRWQVDRKLLERKKVRTFSRRTWREWYCEVIWIVDPASLEHCTILFVPRRFKWSWNCVVTHRQCLCVFMLIPTPHVYSFLVNMNISRRPEAKMVRCGGLSSWYTVDILLLVWIWTCLPELVWRYSHVVIVSRTSRRSPWSKTKALEESCYSVR